MCGIDYVKRKIFKMSQAVGADEKLAEDIVKGFASADTSVLATKEDLRSVETGLKEKICLVSKDLRSVEADLKEDMRALS